MPNPPQYIPDQFIGRGDRTLEQRVANIEGVLLYGDTPPDMFPNAEDRADKVFAYDGDGVPSLLPVEEILADGLETAAEDAQEKADAAQAAAIASASADATSKANAAQVYAIQRSNHTGTQAQSTITGLVSDLAEKVDVAVELDSPPEDQTYQYSFNDTSIQSSNSDANSIISSGPSFIPTGTPGVWSTDGDDSEVTGYRLIIKPFSNALELLVNYGGALETLSYSGPGTNPSEVTWNPLDVLGTPSFNEAEFEPGTPSVPGQMVEDSSDRDFIYFRRSDGTFAKIAVGAGTSVDVRGASPMWLRAAFDDNHSISVCASEDLITWRVLAFWETPKTHARDPQILYHANRWWMVFGNGGFDPTDSFSLAVSDNLTDWELVADIDCSGSVEVDDLLWQPILAHDEDGRPFCTVRIVNGDYLLLRPTDESDLSTLEVVDSFTGPDCMQQSQFFHEGFYYIAGNIGGGEHALFRSLVVTGPYSSVTTIDCVGGDAIGVTVDSGKWYAFLDSPDGIFGNQGNDSVAFQIADAPEDAFGTVQIGFIESLAPYREHVSKNPSIRRHYGPAAIAIRAAVGRRMSVVQRLPLMLPPGDMLYYNQTGGATAGASVIWEGYRPKITTGTGTAGERGYVSLFNSTTVASNFTGAPLLSTLRPFELRLNIESLFSTASIIRLVVCADNTNPQLADIGFGLEFKSTTIDLITHDGTTLTRVSKSWSPKFETAVRIIRFRTRIRVEINGEILFEAAIPLNGDNASQQAVLLAAERVSGADLAAWVQAAEFRFMD